jgi:membrane protease YdiL (CAAX protease family)
MIRNYYRVGMFFLLAYAFTWAGNLGNWLWPSDYWMAPMNPLGPIIAAPLAIWLAEGRSGLIAWLRRIGRFRAPAKVYAAAFVIPLAIIGTAMGLTAMTGATMLPVPQISVGEAILMVPVLLLMGPATEEPAFRGYGLDTLQRTMSPLAAALIIGCGVAIWHLPLLLLGSMAWPWAVCIVLVSVVYAWLYNVGGSVWPLVLLHFTVNFFGSEFLGEVVSSPATQATYAIIYAGLYAVWAAYLVWRHGPALGLGTRAGVVALAA